MSSTPPDKAAPENPPGEPQQASPAAASPAPPPPPPTDTVAPIAPSLATSSPGAVATTAAVAPPPPPPPGPAFEAGAQARALFSQLDPTGLRPTGIVAGIIVAIFFGAQLLNAITPTAAVGPGNPGPGGPGPIGPGPVATANPGGPGPVSTPLPPGSTLTVGPLRIPLENGWVPQEVPGSNAIVRLTKGGVFIDLFSASIQGQADAATVYNAYIREMQQDSPGLGATQPNVVQIGNGQLGARGSYTGVFGQSQIEGEVTTLVVSSTQGFIFDVWAAAGTLRTVLPEAQRMIGNVQVGE